MQPDPSAYDPAWVAALRSLDAATIVAWLRDHRRHVPDVINLHWWIQIHRTRMRCTALTDEERTQSRQFVLDSVIRNEV